jgi:hypothetical protein
MPGIAAKGDCDKYLPSDISEKENIVPSPSTVMVAPVSGLEFSAVKLKVLLNKTTWFVSSFVITASMTNAFSND